MGNREDTFPGLGTSRNIPLGFQVNGTSIYLNGAQFKGIGINHFAMFLRQRVSVSPAVDVAYDLSQIGARYKLPFVRFAVGFYDRASWLAGWYNDRPGFISKLQQTVEQLEQAKVGGILTLFWGLRQFCEITYDAYTIIQGPNNLGEIHSPVSTLARLFISDVVNAVKNSPYVYAFQLVNESTGNCGPEYYSTWAVDGTGVDGGGNPLPSTLNWGLRPDGSTYPASAKLSLAGWQTFTSWSVAYIRSLDPTGRMILGGAGMGNSFAVGAQTNNSLTADTLAQWNSAVAGRSWMDYRDNAFSALSTHVYPLTTSDALFFLDSQKTNLEFIALCKNWATAAKKPFILDEFGASYYAGPPDETSTNFATEYANFVNTVNYIENNIDVSAAWNYSGDLANPTAWMKWDMTNTLRQYQLQKISDTNQRMRASIGLS